LYVHTKDRQEAEKVGGKAMLSPVITCTKNHGGREIRIQDNNNIISNDNDNDNDNDSDE